MGWRGTVRTLGAAYRRYERLEHQRQRLLTREYERHQKLADKQAQYDRAAAEVALSENHIDQLRSIHKECGPPWDWQRIRDTPGPVEPTPGTRHAAAAESAHATYHPSIFDRVLLRSARKRAQLEAAIPAARERDAQSHAHALSKHRQDLILWQEAQDLASRILAHDVDALQDAIDEINPFGELSDLGSGIQPTFRPDKRVEIEFRVNGIQAIPGELRTLLKSGKVSIKKMPAGQFYEIYQDYVCGAVLRIARELFALLPVEFVIITAVSDLLDGTTGHTTPRPIVSVAIPRPRLMTLNFETLDPSDALQNFVHHMDFKKTRGFAPVQPLRLDAFAATS